MACNGHTVLFKRIGSRDSNRYSYATVNRSIIHSGQSANKQGSTNRWKDKPNMVIHTMEEYSAVDRSNILIRAILWMNLKTCYVKTPDTKEQIL